MQGSKELWKSALDEDIEEYIVKSECKQDQGKPRLDLVPRKLEEARHDHKDKIL